MEITCYVATFNRPGNITTPNLLRTHFIRPVLLVHNKDQERLYRQYDKEIEIIVTDSFGSKHAQWMYLLTHVIPDGEYVLLSDDDIVEISTIIEPYRSAMPLLNENNKKVPKQAFSRYGAEVSQILLENLEYAKEYDCPLSGFTNTSNPWIRAQGKRYGMLGMVDGGMHWAKNGEWIRDDKFCGLFHDLYLSICSMAYFGVAIVDSSAHFHHRRRGEGGDSSGAEREAIEERSMKRILDEFPECMKVKKIDKGYKVYLRRNKFVKGVIK